MKKQPPFIFVYLGVVEPNTCWLLHRALYGLRESPMLWGFTRDKGICQLIPHGSEVYQLLQAKTHPSLWMVVKMNDIEPSPTLTHQDLPIQVPAAKSGKKSLITAVTQILKKLWKAGWKTHHTHWLVHSPAVIHP
eukprot:1488084-Amphidinium_carterae.1